MVPPVCVHAVACYTPHVCPLRRLHREGTLQMRPTAPASNSPGKEIDSFINLQVPQRHWFSLSIYGGARACSALSLPHKEDPQAPRTRANTQYTRPKMTHLEQHEQATKGGEHLRLGGRGLTVFSDLVHFACSQHSSGRRRAMRTNATPWHAYHTSRTRTCRAWTFFGSVGGGESSRHRRQQQQRRADVGQQNWGVPGRRSRRLACRLQPVWS